MASSYSEQKDRIRAACDAYQQNPERSMTVFAAEFNVPYHSIRRRLRGTPNKMEITGRNKTLSKLQKEVLINHIKLSKSLEIPPRRKYLYGLINKILRNDHMNSTSAPHTISINWSLWWMEVCLWSTVYLQPTDHGLQPSFLISMPMGYSYATTDVYAL